VFAQPQHAQILHLFSSAKVTDRRNPSAVQGLATQADKKERRKDYEVLGFTDCQLKPYSILHNLQIGRQKCRPIFICKTSAEIQKNPRNANNTRHSA
jgi:hypothetical protein